MNITLSVISGPNKGRSFTFDRHDTFIVGRGSKAHLQLPPKDKYFSRHHFLLEVNPPLCRLTDLESSNGTFVNGQRVTAVDLKTGDVIVGGDTGIRVEIEPMEGAIVVQNEAAKVLDESVSGDLPSGAGVPSIATRRETIRENVPSFEADVDATIQFIPSESKPAAETPPEDAVAEVQGPRLGAFVLLRQLGVGGMGAVHLARHIPTGRQCAVKTIAAGAVASERAIQRFLREAAILGKLKHPNIVSYFEWGHCDDKVFFAMEYVDGTDASKILKRGIVDVGRAVEWMRQLLLALEYAHAEGFVHRDIKPANLLISSKEVRETVKLADFGLARVYHASTLSGLTLEGDVGGSLPFMPPEQITNYRSVDPRGDLYSVGATLYTLLTGRTPYELPKKTAAQMVAILQSQPIEIRQRRTDLPVKLCEVIQRSLSREPKDRYSTAAEMRQQLVSW